MSARRKQLKPGACLSPGGHQAGWRHPDAVPDPLEEFVALAIPELQARLLFRTEYESRTLREDPRLAYPPNRFAAAR